MQEVTPLWSAGGAVLVCEKCYKERIPDETPDIAERIGDFELRAWLKSRLKEAGLGKRIRAINTGCIDVCGKGRVTVTIVPANGDPLESITLDPVDEREALYDRVVARLT